MVATRRDFVRNAVAALLSARAFDLAAEPASTEPTQVRAPGSLQQLFPSLSSSPVSYQRVRMQDPFWLPRQRVTREVTLPWLTGAHDRAGGLAICRNNPSTYQAAGTVVNMEAIKLIEAMATAVGLERDVAMESLTNSWIRQLVNVQGPDGYLEEHFPPGLARPPARWQPVWWSHESFATGHYIESAIAYREAAGDRLMYASALRAADNMAAALLDGQQAYTSGHPEIEQALMRLYGQTSDPKYLRLCQWFLDSRGHHERRPSFGRMRLDDVPVKQQRTLEGHAVMAGYLWNGVTQYVGATGDPGYREAALSVWDDFVDHRMYIHGAGGNVSSKIEGFRAEPDCILPEDAYCESCSVFANFQWAHSLASLTGAAHYLDVADRMLYNAFSGSLSLRGDATFYRNPIQVDQPTPRTQEFATSCCPPNIVKLVNKVGGFFYSTDLQGIFVNHYGASEAHIPWGQGVRLVQRTEYPWDGAIALEVYPRTPHPFTLRLRIPAWANSPSLYVNDRAAEGTLREGWLEIRRVWKGGDRVELNLPMQVRRVTMPPRFKEYANRAAIERGPVVYCLEEQDLDLNPSSGGQDGNGEDSVLASLYIPQDTRFAIERRPNLLDGVPVLAAEIRQVTSDTLDEDRPVRATFVPYGLWDNRRPGAMRVWLGARKAPLLDMLLPEQVLGASCVG